MVLGTDSVPSTTDSVPSTTTTSESAHARSESAHARFEAAPGATPTPAHKPSTRAGERWAYSWVDRRLKVMSVLLPVAFILALEFVHYTVEARDGRIDGFWDGYRPIFIAVTVASILTFGLVMFRFIDRAQRQVVRQNRELAATNALSSAVQGAVGVDRIIDVALESVLTTSGATAASVTIYTTEDRSPDGAGVTRRQLADAGSAVLVPNDPRGGEAPIIDFPLSTGTVTVGRMRLWLPVGAGASDRLASGTLQNIGHQLASAIQLAQLVADLQRRKYEGHAFYDVLLQISNQNRPPEILSAVVEHARNMMSSDEAVLSLEEGASRSVQFAGTLEGIASFADGTTCITSEVGPRHNEHGPEVACPVRSSSEWTANMTVPIRGPIGTVMFAVHSDEDRTGQATSGPCSLWRGPTSDVMQVVPSAKEAIPSSVPANCTDREAPSSRLRTASSLLIMLRACSTTAERISGGGFWFEICRSTS